MNRVRTRSIFFKRNSDSISLQDYVETLKKKKIENSNNNNLFRSLRMPLYCIRGPRMLVTRMQAARMLILYFTIFCL